MPLRSTRAFLTILVWAGVASVPVSAESERTTALVTVARANAHCLITTGTMKPDQAMAIANRFLDAQNINQKSRRAVNNAPEFNDLMNRYISDQGGCQAIIRDLQ